MNHDFPCFPGFRIWCTHFFLYKQHFYKQHQTEIGKKIKQRLSNTLRLNFCYLKIICFRHPRYHPKRIGHILKNIQKSLCICFFNEIILLIIMKVKKKNRSHPDTTKMNLSLDMSSHILNIKNASVWWYLFALSNNQPALEVQFMKRLRNTEGVLKKMCCLYNISVYSKKRKPWNAGNRQNCSKSDKPIPKRLVY